MMKALIASVAATALLSGAAFAQTDAGAADPAAAASEQRVGMGVFTSDGQQVGVIESIETAEDGSETAIVSVGTYLGLGSKKISVPASDLTLNADGNGYTTALTAEEIEAAPEYAPE
jgi:hypothetical protein